MNAQVGALRKLRQDMLAICLAIQVQLLEELHSKVYASSSTALQQQQYNSQAVQPHSPRQQQQQQQQRSETPPRSVNSPRGPASPLRSSPRGSPRVHGAAGGNFPGSSGAGQSVVDELRAQQQKVRQGVTLLHCCCCCCCCCCWCTSPIAAVRVCLIRRTCTDKYSKCSTLTLHWPPHG
jgi:hypothetical protein